MDKAENKSPKKSYSTPEFTVYGTVAQLTKMVGNHGNRDSAGGGPNHRTHV